MPSAATLMNTLVAGEASALDAAMLSACPLAVVPGNAAAFVPLSVPGRRLLLATDGVYLEARSHVLSCRLKIAECRLPFGPTTNAVDIIGKPLPRVLFMQLARKAREAHPREMAALIVRDSGDKDRILVPEQVGKLGQVDYDDTVVDESRLVIDAHSHGPYSARFSRVDDESDRSRIGPHVSVLFGSCETGDSMRIAARVCVGSYLVEIGKPALAALFEPDTSGAFA